MRDLPSKLPFKKKANAQAALGAALSEFLRRGHIRRVHLAQGTRPPPPLAYMVHFPRLSVTLRGTDPMLIEHSGRARLVRPGRGEAVLVPANCWNRPNWTEPSSTLNVLFGRSHIGLSLVTHDGRGPEPGPAVKTAIRGEAEGPLRQMMQALIGLGARCPEAAPLLVEALLRSALASLRHPPDPAPTRASGLYDSICMYVQEHFQFPLGRETVAAHFHITPNHVSRLFQRHGAVGFNDYVTYVRVDRAKYLLKSYAQSVADIASACGFADVAYFCRVFKSVTKQTPTSYRNQRRPLEAPALRVSEA